MLAEEKKVNPQELESICETCRGKGGWSGESGWRDCGHCNGTGYLPTDLGKKILLLIRHNKKLVLH